MKKLLATFAFLVSVFSARADLSVEWIDGNTIRVSGEGYTVVTNTVYTNSLGTCTNCVQISPEQMRQYKTDIISSCDGLDELFTNIQDSLYNVLDRCDASINDINSFQRFYDLPGSSSGFSWSPFTNYIYSVDNTQATLDKTFIRNTSSTVQQRIVSYNNGIYDYANTYVLPDLQSTYDDADLALQDLSIAQSFNDSIRSIVTSMSEESCACQGDAAGICPDCGDGGGSCGDCPCAEQLDAIKDYVEHLDDDFHKELVQMSAVTNFIPRMDSYAKLVSRVLYNDATIVVDDGQNSWSNVYRRGYSDLYDYDKSNILQRIELLLFGVTYNTSTNWGNSVDSLEETSDELRGNFDDAESSVRSQADSLKSDIELIEEKFTTFIRYLNFFGAGTLGEFSVSDPFTVFGAYDFEISSSGLVSDLAPFQQISRTCFQIFYWLSASIFMIWFWWSFISFVINHVFTLLKFFNNLLT